MKKLLTFVLLALLTIGASAQTRRTWDFTKGFSSTTIENLKAAGWTDETAGRTIQSGARSEGELKYTIDGVEWTCPELAGLIVHAKSAKHFVIAYDSNNSGFKGKSFIWINGKKAEDCLTIPNVPVGEDVTIVYESHSTTDNRGFKVTSGDFADAAGQKQFTSHGDTVRVVLVNNNATDADLKIQATNGFHIYKIIIGAGDVVENAKIAYLYNETEGDAGARLKSREDAEVTAIDVATATVTAESLQQFSLVVIDANVPADNAAVSVVKETMPFTPMLNLNANLYAAWGYGEAVPSEQPLGIVKDSKSELLTGAIISKDEDSGIEFVEFEGSITAVKLGDYFKSDATPLVMYTEGESEDKIAVAHLHNIGHNGYAYTPFLQKDGETTIFDNAVNMLLSSKKEVTAAPKPGVSFEYKNLKTIVTLKAAGTLEKPHVYYTLDGSEPTMESPEYTEPFEVTETGKTVKAVAIGEGYLLSEVQSAEIDIKEQPKTPVIAAAYASGSTTVTITCETTGNDVVLYYNFSGSTNIKESNIYTGPIVITQPRDITAFAVAADVVFSEVASERVAVKDAVVAVDIVSHFSVPSGWVYKTVNAETGEETATTLGNNGSLFSANMNTTSSAKKQGEQIGEDPETGDPIYADAEVDWMIQDEPGENPQWQVMSKGEVVLYQTNAPKTTNFGDDNDVNPASEADVDSIFVATKNNLHFYKCYSGENQNAAIQSKVKFQAPFNVAVIACLNGGSSCVQVSADGENWTVVGDTITQATSNARMFNLIKRYYDGTDEVYVRLAATGGSVTSGHKIYDIYVANAGEKSAAMKAEFDEEAKDIVTAGSGDVNGDGKVDVEDVVGIVNKILGEPAENFIQANADVTGDGKIDVDDVVAVVNIILNSNEAADAPAMVRILTQNGFRF